MKSTRQSRSLLVPTRRSCSLLINQPANATVVTSIHLINVYDNIQTTNPRAWKTPSCICSCQLCFKSEVCCGGSWKLRRVAGEARDMMENALSILIVIFSVQLQQTEISERKPFIFHLGRHCCTTSTSQTYNQSQAHSHCDVTHSQPL